MYFQSLSLRGERGNRDRPPRGGIDGGREGNRLMEGTRDDSGDHRGDHGMKGIRKGLRGREDRDTAGGPKSGGGSINSSGSEPLISCKAQSSAPTTLFDMISTQVNLPEQQQQLHTQIRARGGDDNRTPHNSSHQQHGHNGFAPFSDQYSNYENNGAQRGNRTWFQGNTGVTNLHSSAQGNFRGQDGPRGGIGNRGERQSLSRGTAREDLNRRFSERSYDHRNRDSRESQGYRDGTYRRSGHDNTVASSNRGTQRGQQRTDNNYVAEFPTLPNQSGSNLSRLAEGQEVGRASPIATTTTVDNQGPQTRNVSGSHGSSGSGPYQADRNATTATGGPLRSVRNCGGGTAVQYHHSTHKLKTGQRVYAKYWEDESMYRAVVHEMAASGRTCVVYFVEYGNYEEVSSFFLYSSHHHNTKWSGYVYAR